MPSACPKCGSTKIERLRKGEQVGAAVGGTAGAAAGVAATVSAATVAATPAAAAAASAPAAAEVTKQIVSRGLPLIRRFASVAGPLAGPASAALLAGVAGMIPALILGAKAGGLVDAHILNNRHCLACQHTFSEELTAGLG